MSPAAPTSTLIPRHRRGLLASVLAPPLIFLAMLTVRYSLVVAACRYRIVRIPLEAAAILGLGGLVWILVHAWRTWRRAQAPLDSDDPLSTDRWLGGLAVLSAAFSLIATLAVWLPSAFLGPCGTDMA